MPITIQVASDGPPKRRLIEMAFGKLGSAGYEFGRTAEEVADALMSLDAMMLEWPWNRLNYAQPPYGLGSPDDYSGIPSEATNGVVANLALTIAPVMGATLSAEAKASLGTAISRIYALTATIRSMPYPRNTARGMGLEQQRVFQAPFINEDFDDINTTPVPINAPASGPLVVTVVDTDDDDSL